MQTGQIRIMETNLRFNSLNKRQETTRIVVHHSASTDVTASRIHQWHLARGWSGIGYHYVIRSNGAIERGRPEWARGAHAPPANNDAVGICLAGNFETGKPGAVQIDSLAGLIQDIRSRYNRNLPVIGHKDLMATACPGRYFPWEKLHLKLKEGKKVADAWKIKIVEDAKTAGLITSEHNPDETASKWFVLAVALNLLKTLKGK